MQAKFSISAPMRTWFSFDTIGIVAATCAAIALLYIVPQNFGFLSPFTQALGDFDLTDMVFTQFRNDDDVAADTSIVVVNIGDCNRSEIAVMIDRIRAQQPRVIGVDAFFRQPKAEDPYGDSLLASVCASTPNLVLVSKVAYRSPDSANTDHPFDTLETSHPMFASKATTGYANLIIDQESAFMTVRTISFVEECAGRTEPSFALRLAELANPAAARIARDRGSGEELINFRGGAEKFYVLDVEDVRDSAIDLGILRGKVVILGYMGDRLGQQSFTDNFFTPLNRAYAGRSYPDMYGVVIHANVVSMILAGRYIASMPLWLSLALGVFVLWINVGLFTYIFAHANNWYDTIALVLQLGQSLLFLYLTIVMYDLASYKLALTPALVAVALVGTVHDLYHDSIKKLVLAAFERARRLRSRNAAPPSSEDRS